MPFTYSRQPIIWRIKPSADSMGTLPELKALTASAITSSAWIRPLFK